MARALALSLLVVLVAAFALLNWTAFATPTVLSLGVTTVQAPLGLLMLGLLLFVCVLFTVWAISLQASALRESRRQTRELATQRELADKAEASRFTELRAHLNAELMRVTQAAYDTRIELMARLDRMQQESQLALEQNTNSLAASIGELEDRLEHLPGADGNRTAIGAPMK